MSPSIPKTMKAAVIDKFGGPEVLHLASIPVPGLADHEVLVRVQTAGIGVWDPWLRGGGSSLRRFPMVLGSDGAGTVAACGSKVRRLKTGERVYGYGYENPKGGFYAEYAVVPEENMGAIPAGVSVDEAGALAVSAITALAGLDKLKVAKDCALMIVGASGGVGHVALQLGKRMGARVLAVASGKDGVDLVRRLGADGAVDGLHDDIVEAAKAFAPNGLDAVLACANSEELAASLKRVKRGGAIAYPNGVDPEPEALPGVKLHAYDGLPSRETFDRLSGLIAEGPFQVEISRTYRLEEAAQAHRDILKHHLGKLALKIQD
jgi:NADPH2:quinone reductase